MPPPKLMKIASVEQLTHHPFELIGMKVEEARHFNYAKRILQDKITKGHIAVWIKPTEFIEVHKIFYQSPLCDKMVDDPSNQDSLNQYAPYVHVPAIRKLLSEIMNRDLNLQRCLVFAPEVDDPFQEHTVSYPSNDGSLKCTKPLPLSLFCSIVSSASRFQTIEEIIPVELNHRVFVSKLAQKAKDKEQKAAKVTKDRMKLGDHVERVERKVFGVPIGGWIPSGTRAGFIRNQRQKIAENQGRNIDSSDSDDTLSEDDVDLYN